MRTCARWLAFAALCVAGAAACRGGPPLPRRVVDLTPPLTSDIDLRRLGSRTLRFLGTEGRLRITPVLPQQPEHWFGVESIELLTHSGAHLDAPARLLRGGEPPARIGLERLMGPARLADLRWHDRQTPLQISDLELVDISAGDVVILFAGYEPPRGDKWPAFAPLSRQASEYLAAKRIRALATDLPSIASFEQIDARLRSQLPPEEVWEEYLPLMRAQIPIMVGLVNLDTLLDEKRVLFQGFPLPLADAKGAPVRAAALIY